MKPGCVFHHLLSGLSESILDLIPIIGLVEELVDPFCLGFERQKGSLSVFKSPFLTRMRERRASLGRAKLWFLSPTLVSVFTFPYRRVLLLVIISCSACVAMLDLPYGRSAFREKKVGGEIRSGRYMRGFVMTWSAVTVSGLSFDYERSTAFRKGCL